ncbi:MAG: hypothetical protein RTU63_07765 [Candidatus Thorarchaeota archaeon]
MYDNTHTKLRADTPPDVWGFVEITCDYPTGTPNEPWRLHADYPTGTPNEPW